MMKGFLQNLFSEPDLNSYLKFRKSIGKKSIPGIQGNLIKAQKLCAKMNRDIQIVEKPAT